MILIMKKINLKIRVLDDGRVAFRIDKNYNFSEFEIIGMLELIKQSQLEKIRELENK